MAITDRTRKILWARSAGRCAMCKQRVIVSATDADSEAVVGEECHIVSGVPGGPRYDPSLPAARVDGYDNLILLCGTHHTEIDTQVGTYPVARLREMRTRHEEAVAAATEPTRPRPGDEVQREAAIPSPDTFVVKVGMIWSQRADIDAGHEVIRFKGSLLAKTRREDVNGPTWRWLYRLQSGMYLVYIRRNWRGDYEEAWLGRADPDSERTTLTLDEVQQQFRELAAQAGIPRVRIVE